MKGETTQGNTESTIDAELGDLPLEIEYEEDFDSEIPQIPQDTALYEPPEPGEEWIAKGMAAIRVFDAVTAVAQTPEGIIAERIKKNKRKFLEVFLKHMGTIGTAAEIAGIDRSTYYDWVKTDPQFRSMVTQLEEYRDRMIEDELFALIQKHDGPSIRFYLERTNPKYKATSKTEIVTGDKTFEELLYSQAEKRRGQTIKVENNG